MDECTNRLSLVHMNLRWISAASTRNPRSPTVHGSTRTVDHPEGICDPSEGEGHRREATHLFAHQVISSLMIVRIAMRLDLCETHI